MKNFILGLLALSSISAFAGECRLQTKGYGCRYDEFGPCEPLFKNTLDNTVLKITSAEECLSLAREKKAHFSNIPENRGAKIVFTKVKISFTSEEEKLQAELK